MRRITALLLAVIALSELSACAGAKPSTVTCRSSRPTADYEFAAAGGTSIRAARPGINQVLLSPRMHDSVAVRSMNVSVSGTGLSVLSAELINCSGSEVRLKIRTQFLGREGAPSEPTSAWRDVFLDPKSFTFYRENALAENSVSALLEIDLQ